MKRIKRESLEFSLRTNDCRLNISGRVYRIQRILIRLIVYIISIALISMLIGVIEIICRFYLPNDVIS